jgi:hypothetical protein
MTWIFLFDGLIAAVCGYRSLAIGFLVAATLVALMAAAANAQSDDSP